MDRWLTRQWQQWRHALLRMAFPLIAALLAHSTAATVLTQSTGARKCDPTVQSCAPGTGGGISIGGGSGSGGGSCTPTPGGSPCGGAGPASQGSSSPVNQGAGNPIHLINGNKYQREVDMPALPGVLGLEVVRHYNSEYSRPNVPPGMLGRGWLLSYEARLYETSANLQIVQADGTRIIFSKNPDTPSLCASEQPGNGIVRIFDAEGAQQGNQPTNQQSSKQAHNRYFVWRWMDGRELRFNRHGRLTTIGLPTGERVRLRYNAHGTRLLQVTDPQGRSLHLRYSESAGAPGTSPVERVLVQAIDSPVGRIEYRHGSAPLPGSTQPADKLRASLVQARLPGASAQEPVERHYHYEDPRHPTLLTGISVQGQGSDGQRLNERIASYGYAANGRAILSVRGAPGSRQDRITLDLSQPWKNTLTNSLGQQTTYHYDTIGGQWRLLQVRGPGCASCGPGNLRYQYDAQGRLTETTRLDEQGRPLEGLRTQLDPFGRPLTISRIAYAHGKPQTPQWLVRYEYGKDAWRQYGPELIARPSVVAGREHQVRIQYNAWRQPLEITETGYSPLDQNGAVAGDASQAMPLERRTRYRYQGINRRSVLVEIDGPLPNRPGSYEGGPLDDDITRLHWDADGNRVLRVEQPGGVDVVLEHDAAGRLLARQETDGVRRLRHQIRYSPLSFIALQPQDHSVTGWQLDAQGQLLPDSQQAMNLRQVRHDALGRLSRATDAAGRSVEWAYQGGDTRSVTVGDPQGHRQRTEHDSEGRITRMGLYRPGQDRPERAAYFGWDAQGRLSHRLLPDGRLDSYAYGDAGELLQHIDGDDIRTRWLQGGTLQARLSQTPDGFTRLALTGAGAGSPGNAPATGALAGSERQKILKDDFGRTVLMDLGAHGRQSARYDSADRLLLHTRADGSSTRYLHYGSGRMLNKTYEPAPGPRRDMGADHSAQRSTTLHYQGSLLHEADGPEQRERIIYDALGRPVERSIALAMPDGKTAHRYRTATRYGGGGLVHSRTLADGRVLVTRRGPASEGASVQSLHLQSAWVAALLQTSDHWLGASATALLERMLPWQTVASGIQIDSFNGLRQYTAGNGITTTRRHDIAGRLTQQAIGQIATQRYGYGVGPRIQSIEQAGPPALRNTVYRYRGFGMLVPATEPADAAEATRLQPVSMPGRAPSQAILAHDLQGRTTQDRQYRYTYTASGQVQSISDLQGTLIARYRYNSQGQRVGKTVHRGGMAHHSHYLWQSGLLVAEMDGEGRITSQYLYLSEGTRAIPIAKLESAHNPDNPSGKARTLYIHNDHRGSPQAMTDERQRVVWRSSQTPWGGPEMQPAAEKTRLGEQAVLNLRLPGQYFDAETGLHDNWHRTYDPAAGRYLQPDPLGYPDGPDAYLYAGGDPINRIDPTGLYQEDMHYYMVFFLALAAGLDYEPARITALASQYVDDNPITRPLDDATVVKTIGSIFKNKRQLLWYHFTLSDEEGNTLTPYDNSNVNSVVGNLSPQLQNLLNASRLGNPEQPCAEFQFLGEFLHAYLDTFSHRDKKNRPVDALTLGLGVGHGFSGSEPDYTYNDQYIGNDPIVLDRIWTVRANRTLAGQRAVYEFLTSYGTKPAIGFSEIEKILIDFNKIREDGNEFPEKIRFLKKAIDQLIKDEKLKLIKNTKDNVKTNVVEIKIEKGGDDEYQRKEAERNRKIYLDSLAGQEDNYPGVCLPRSPVCKEV